MKLSTLLVAGSLAANVALVAVYVSRTDSTSSGSRVQPSAASNSPKTPAAAAKRSAVAKASRPMSAAPSSDTWEKLNKGDLRALADRLRAAGFPAAVVRAVITMQVNESFKTRRAALVSTNADRPFWETERSGGIGDVITRQRNNTAMRELNREQSRLVTEILGPDPNANNPLVTANQRRRLGDLPAEKIEQLQRLDQDYNDMRNEVSLAARGMMLPEDRQKLSILEEEKRADLAKLLSPQELEDYLVRTSTTTSRLRQALTVMDATESEFRAIDQAQSAFDEKYNPSAGGISVTTVEILRERQAQQAAVGEQIKAALGEERYADYTRASDREFQQLSQLAQNANLPEATALQVYNFREKTLKESNRIFEDSSLTADQKRAALQALGQSARTGIAATLGPEVSERYLSLASRWLAGLDRGAAVTLTATGGMQTRNVPNPRPAPNGARGAPAPNSIQFAPTPR